MKTETALTRINEIISMLDNSDLYSIQTELLKFAGDLSAQVRMEYAASRGQGNATKTIVSMLNAVKKNCADIRLQYAWMDANGHQCVCDGFRAFRLTEALPLEERPDDVT